MIIDSKDVLGTFPTEPCVFAACDSKYFVDHASPFINSAHLAGKPCHVHVVNPTQQVFELFEYYKTKVTTPSTLSYNYMDIPDDVDAMKCTYASLRFFILPYLLEKIEKIMVLDIDCMVMKKFRFPEKPCGLFVREPVTYLSDWIKEGTKIAAGIVYFDKSYLDKAKKLIEIINSLPKQMMKSPSNDRIALKGYGQSVSGQETIIFASYTLSAHPKNRQISAVWILRASLPVMSVRAATNSDASLAPNGKKRSTWG